MVYEQRQQAAVNEVLVWLEDEVRESKAQIARLRQDVDSASGRTGDLAVEVHRAQDETRTFAGRLDNLPPFSQQISQLRDQLAASEEAAAARERRLIESLGQQKLDTERLRQELNGTYRRIELLERSTANWGGRFERLDETDRHTQEAIALVRQRSDALEHEQELAASQSSRVVELFRRYEHDLAQRVGELEAIQKQQTLLRERSQVHSEMLKRLEDRVDQLEADLTAQAEIFEKLDLLQSELHRLEDRIAAGEQTSDDQRGRLDGHQHLLGLLDGKDRGFADRLKGLQEDFSTYRLQIGEQFQRLQDALDRQKRRQIEDLERDLRELKTTAFRPLEDFSPSPAPAREGEANAGR